MSTAVYSTINTLYIPSVPPPKKTTQPTGGIFQPPKFQQNRNFNLVLLASPHSQILCNCLIFYLCGICKLYWNPLISGVVDCFFNKELKYYYYFMENKDSNIYLNTSKFLRWRSWDKLRVRRRWSFLVTMATRKQHLHRLVSLAFSSWHCYSLHISRRKKTDKIMCKQCEFCKPPCLC